MYPTDTSIWSGSSSNKAANQRALPLRLSDSETVTVGIQGRGVGPCIIKPADLHQSTLNEDVTNSLAETCIGEIQWICVRCLIRIAA